MVKNRVGYVQESLGQMSSHSECAALEAAVPEGNGVLQESSAAGVCDSCISETAAAPAPDSSEVGLQKPGSSK